MVGPPNNEKINFLAPPLRPKLVDSAPWGLNPAPTGTDLRGAAVVWPFNRCRRVWLQQRSLVARSRRRAGAGLAWWLRGAGGAPRLGPM